MFLPTNAVATTHNLVSRDYDLAQVGRITLPENANTTQVAPASFPKGSAVHSNVVGSGHYVLYQDAYSAIPAASDIASQGYNVYAPAFWLSTSGPFDTLLQFCNAPDKQSVLDSYHAAGIKVIATAFGFTDKPQDKYPNAADAANAIADFVTGCGLDGVDIDYEDLDRFNNGQGASWIIDLTKNLRNRLPQGQYLLTHAPLGPWLARALYPNDGGYATVNDQVGGLIDWYNVQYYNQNDAYTTKDTLLNQAASPFVGSAVNQVIQNDGFDASKIVIGKAATPADAPSGGYVAPGDLGSWLNGASFAGISIWQAPHQGTYLSEARAAGGF